MPSYQKNIVKLKKIRILINFTHDLLKFHLAHVILCLFTMSAILLRIQSELGSTYTQNLFTFHATSQLTALTTTCIDDTDIYLIC